MSKSDDLKRLVQEGEKVERQEAEIIETGKIIKDLMEMPGFVKFSAWLKKEQEALKDAIFEVEEDTTERISHETMRIKFQKRALDIVEEWFKDKIKDMEEVLDENPKLAEELKGKSSSTTSENA